MSPLHRSHHPWVYVHHRIHLTYLFYRHKGRTTDHYIPSSRRRVQQSRPFQDILHFKRLPVHSPRRISLIACQVHNTLH
jgi:hypothetical protein